MNNCTTLKIEKVYFQIKHQSVNMWLKLNFEKNKKN